VVLVVVVASGVCLDLFGCLYILYSRLRYCVYCAREKFIGDDVAVRLIAVQTPVRHISQMRRINLLKLELLLSSSKF
jgi:hypothetical protein